MNFDPDVPLEGDSESPENTAPTEEDEEAP